MVSSEALFCISAASLTRYPNGASQHLMRAVAETLGVEERQVVPGFGASDLLNRIFSAFANCGAEAVMPTPGWSYYHEVMASHDVRVHPLALRVHPERFDYDLGGLLRAIRQRRPSLVMLTSPNNPTGNRLSYRDALTLAQTTPRSLVVIDEAYYGFAPDDSIPVAELLAAAPNLILLRTLSKAYGLAGLRVGFALSGEMGRAILGRTPIPFGLPWFAQEVAAARIRDETWLPRVRLAKMRSLEALSEGLGSPRGVTVFESDANFVLVRLPPGQSIRVDSALGFNGFKVKRLRDPQLQDHLRITLASAETMRAVGNCIRGAVSARVSLRSTPESSSLGFVAETKRYET